MSSRLIAITLNSIDTVVYSNTASKMSCVLHFLTLLHDWVSTP